VPRKLSAAPRSLAELIARARKAHAAVSGEPRAALLRAFEAGDALLAIKAQVAHGEWGACLRETGIPLSTARLYMQLARERERILAAGCRSIREARRLLAGTAPRPPRDGAGGGRRGRTEKDAEDRYKKGYAKGYEDGYRRGRSDGIAAGQAAAQGRRGAEGDGKMPLDRKDLRWLVKLTHPDRHDGDLRATRVTQWLNDLLRTARDREKEERA
jgi:hypothetical protein